MPSTLSEPQLEFARAAPAPDCAVCGRRLAPQEDPDIWRCAACGYQCSTFAEGATAARLDEPQRRRALEALRRENARTLLAVLAGLHSLPGARLCDIGCGYGWLLDEARRQGADVLGIEPDRPVAAEAIELGGRVRCGWFPDCLDPAERFDILTLCDVLEHLPDVGQMLAACRRHLVPGGLLAVALPTSEGVVFRAATKLRRLGIRGPLDRLWQRGYPSPHVHYFQTENLGRLLADSGFERIAARPLPAWQLTGLWARLRMDPRRPKWTSALEWLALAAAWPLCACLPGDTVLQVYRKRDAAD